MAVWNIIALSDIRSGFRIDSEFYKSEYISKDHELSKLKTYALGHLAKVTDGEHGSVLFIQNGVKYLTAEHIKQGYIDADSARFVSEEVDRRNARASVSTGDVLISIKGTLGEVGLAEASLLPANMNRDVAIIKLFPNSPSSEYITVFLRSRFGEYQLAREGSGGVQQMITLERLRNIRIPIIAGNSEDEVSRLYQTGLKKRQESIDLYSQALQLLESELGLEKLNFQKPMGYTARFSEAIISRRLDADYYQPKYRQLDDIASKFPVKRIKAISEKLETGLYSPNYSDLGQKYIRGTDIQTGYVDDADILNTDAIKISSKSTVKEHDILVTRVGSIGVCGIVEEWFSGSFYSDNLIRIRLTALSKSELSPQYLNLLLNTTYGQMQMLRYSRGSVQQRLNQSQLAEIPIPIIPWKTQGTIEHLLSEHRLEKVKAQNLLEQAKARVEQLIEEAVQS